MRARHLLLLLPVLGCVHAQGAPVSAARASAREHTDATPPPRAAAAARARVPRALPTLHDVAWKLRHGEAGSWAETDAALQTFSLGRWECALSQEQRNDVLGPTHLALRRHRRLACTHATGATVQTEVACALHATLAGGSDAAQDTERVLQIRLDTSPTLFVQCAPREVSRVTLLRPDDTPLAELCVQPGGVVACAAASAR